MQPTLDVCAELCGRHPGCKSWTYSYGKQECYTFKLYMPFRKQQTGFASGLPKRVVLKNLDVEQFHEPKCCLDKLEWTPCQRWGWAECPSGTSYVTWSWCGFMQNKAQCKRSCIKKDYGCGCGKPCTLGVPPQGHEGFVRFCEHPNGKGKCCDQAGSPNGRSVSLDTNLGCPHDASLSSIEVVGNCNVQLFTKPNGGKRFTILGEGRYDAGGSTFPDNAITFATITCPHHHLSQTSSK